MQGARALGFSVQEMLTVFQVMKPRHFFKSMTSYHDHTQWQDVYYVPYEGLVLYVKFTTDCVTGFRLLSFKEK